MRVQRVVMPVTGVESWTVVADDWSVVAPAERYLAHLAGIERSPNRLRAYAHGLRLWFEFLGRRDLAWDGVGVEDVSRFVAWLRSPADNVIVFDDRAAVRSEATVNRHLAALFGFYDFHARSGVVLAADLVAWRRVSRGSYKPFLHHISRGRPIATRPIKLRVPRRLPATLSVEDITVILAACDHLRDRFLFALLAETGMRIGQALGLRHEDFVSRQRRVTIVPRGERRTLPSRGQPPPGPRQPRSAHRRPRSHRRHAMTAALAAAARQRSHDTRHRAIDALRHLDANGEPVTFTSVARAASVSRSWLYRQHDLRAEIDRLRPARTATTTPLPSAQRTSADSLQRRLEASLDEIQRLKAENHQLRAQAAQRLGQQRVDGTS